MNEKYIDSKPTLFKEIVSDTHKLERYIEGNSYEQLKLKLMLSNWLKSINPALSRMKKIKRTSFISGEGELGDISDDES